MKKRRKPDQVLVAGDLYEHRAAAPDADALIFRVFVRLYEAGIPVVLIPGNHDASTCLEALASLLKPIHIYAVPRVARPESGSVVEVFSRDGSEAALVACIPFVPERRFGDAAGLFEASESWYASYAEGMAQLMGEMARAFAEYIADVQNRSFPAAEHTVDMPDEEWAALQENLDDLP